MEKPIVFISHITEEKEIAKLLRDHIQESFLELLDLYLSTDPDNNTTGSIWFDVLMKNLLNAKAILVLCSHKSVIRPWINFEAGAAWAKDIDVIPVCHSGFASNDLVPPLSLRQGVEIQSVLGTDEMFRTLARVLGSKSPLISHDNFQEAVKSFSEKYLFWDDFNLKSAQLKKFIDFSPK